MLQPRRAAGFCVIEFNYRENQGGAREETGYYTVCTVRLGLQGCTGASVQKLLSSTVSLPIVNGSCSLTLLICSKPEYNVNRNPILLITISNY